MRAAERAENRKAAGVGDLLDREEEAVDPEGRA